MAKITLDGKKGKPVLSESQIKTTLNGFINDFIQRSNFFKDWESKPVDLALSQKFLLSFDSLVQSFPSLIAAGIARMEDETTRVVLAVNLFQESGEGNIHRTHHAIYRKFLTTAGLSPSPNSIDPFAMEWKTRLLEEIQGTPKTAAALGVLAAGEFLAQPALSRIYQAIQPHYPQADQEYFTKHLVLEEDHVQEITVLIARIAPNEKKWEETIEGFQFGLSIWNVYFNRLNEWIRVGHPAYPSN